MDIKQIYREETGLDVYVESPNYEDHFSDEYVKWLEQQLLIQRVSCFFADKEILSNSLRFALTETPTDEQGALKDFKKYQALMRKCMLWLKDNYEPPCDGFMNECEA
jgi:hypothetical protein